MTTAIDSTSIDTLRAALSHALASKDSLQAVANEALKRGASLSFDNLSLAIGVVAFVLAVLLVAAQIYVQIRLHKQQMASQQEQFRRQVAANKAELQNRLIAEIIAKMRHEWMQVLRSELSQLLAKLITYQRQKAASQGLISHDMEDLRMQMNAHRTKITMMLSPDVSSKVGSEDEAELIHLLDRTVDALGEGPERIGQLVGMILNCARRVFKTTWETLKDEVRGLPSREP